MEQDKLKTLLESGRVSAEALKTNVGLFQETDRLNNNLQEAVDLINESLKEAGSTDSICKDDIKFTNARLTNSYYFVDDEVDEDMHHMRMTSNLSNAVFDAYYPKPEGELFIHYTNLSALKGILKDMLKIKSLITNYNDEEFKAFYTDHGIDGYALTKDDRDIALEEKLMRESYAMCFASPHGLTYKNEDALWRSFADNGGGIKIEFRIISNHPDFRKIFYKPKGMSNEDLLFNLISRKVKARYNRDFSVAGISKIGAFYLPGGYLIENEVRFLIKKHTDEYGFHLEERNGYIMLPFVSEYGTFTINKITPGYTCSMDSLIAIINESKYTVEELLSPAS